MNRPILERHPFAANRSSANIRNQSTQYTIIVKNIPANVSREAIIDFASNFGVLAFEPHITQITQKLYKLAFLTFIDHSAIEQCMNGDRSQYKISGYPVITQRWIPQSLQFERSFRLLIFLENNFTNDSLSENDIRDYFETNYGQTKAFSWTSNSSATLDFDDYDSTDLVVLDKYVHTINGVQLRIEKVKSSNVRSALQQIIAPHTVQYCVHVKKIPSYISGEELADIFNSNIWDILIRKGIFPDTDPFEAWILNIADLNDAEQLATSISSIDNVDVECSAEKEPLNEWTLCNGNRDGWCKHGNDCIYRHVVCPSGDHCIKEECLFTHTKQRKTKPNPKNRPPGPIEQQYRIKLDGLPYHMKAIELLTELKSQPLNLLQSIETPQVPSDSKTRHFYLVRQAAEKLARKRIYEWHNYPIRENYLVKCQLEYDRVPATERSSTRSLFNSVSENENQRLRTIFGPLLPGIQSISGMPIDWIWTNRRLGKKMSDVFLVYPAEPMDNRLAVMKVYRDQSKLESLRAKRELLALSTLQNKPTIATVYESNILNATRKKDAPMWIITQLVSELTLEDFIDKHRSELTFHQSLIIIRKILEIIQYCHEFHIIHRNIHPSNFLVQQSNHYYSSLDEIKLVLIDFGLAWIDNQELSITDDDDVKIIKQMAQQHSASYLLSLSSKDQRCSSTIDSTGVCRIFFWLLTNKWSDQDTTVCLDELDCIEDFQSDLKLCKYIDQIFDRAFGPYENRWPINELLDHLNLIDTLIVELETSQLNTLFPVQKMTKELSFDDLFARIVTLIAHVKRQFAEQYSTSIKWLHGCNKWLTKNKDVEVKNTDELIYDYQGKSCTLPIIFLAKIENGQASLFIGNNTEEEETIQLKYLCNLTRDTNDSDVYKYFDTTLKKLIRNKLSVIAVRL